MVRWGEQTFEEMMIGYLDMDVPVGTEVLRSNDFRPRSERATMNALQSMRRVFGRDQAAGGQTKKAAEKVPGNDPASFVPSAVQCGFLAPSHPHPKFSMRFGRAVGFAVLLLCAASLSSPARAADDEDQARDIPADFAPFEYLVGKWKGQGIPKDSSAKQFRGWTEKHAWAWIFDHGKPSGLSFTIDGGKILASGKLTFDQPRKLYHLEGKESGSARAGNRV